MILAVVLVFAVVVVAIALFMDKPDKRVSESKEKKTISSDVAEESTWEYDEDDVIERSKEVIMLIDEADYETLREQADDMMQSFLNENKIGESKRAISSD